MPVAVEVLAQVLERLGVAYLLYAEHVEADLADHAGELGQLGLVGLLIGPVIAARAEEVLEVPRSHDHGIAHPTPRPGGSG